VRFYVVSVTIFAIGLLVNFKLPQAWYSHYVRA